MRTFGVFSIACTVLAGPAPGRLCIAAGECRDGSCGAVVTPGSERRAYTIAEEPNRYRLGILKPSETVIRCAQRGLLELLIPRPASRNPVTVRVSEAGEGALMWELTIRRAGGPAPVILSMPEGRYELDVHAPHAVRYRKSVNVSAERQRVVTHLPPLPVIAGRVLDGKTGREIGGAAIRSDAGIDEVADPTGRFAVEADPEQWPRAITVSAAGYASADAFVPSARASTSLDDIRLYRGGTVAVELRQTQPGQVTQVALQRLGNGGRSAGPTVKTVEVPEHALSPTVNFENVEPGDYVVVARGNEEWERLGEPVSLVAGGDSRLILRIEPFAVRFRVRHDGTALAGANIVLKQRDVHWQGSLKTDASGEAKAALWQGGRLNATVEAVEAMPYLERRTLLDGVETDWLLEVPLREITGLVVDARTETVIPGAAVHLSMNSVDGYSLGVSTKADGNGRFRFAPVPYGEHTLKAAAPGYPPHATTYSFHEPEQSRDLRLTLERGSKVVLSVLTPRGSPIAGARAIDFLALVKRGTAATDASGTVTVLVSEGEKRDVWIVPRDGSFAWTELRADTRQAAVHVPAAVSRIVLETKSEANVPIPNVSVVIRFNGRILPFEVVHALATMQGSRTRSGADG
ncbi:MAG TPA: carboxypeptidase regulatory-like domain-containing protein, partial [Thermoanaerobaculia bacterium]